MKALFTGMLFFVVSVFGWAQEVKYIEVRDASGSPLTGGIVYSVADERPYVIPNNGIIQMNAEYISEHFYISAKGYYPVIRTSLLNGIHPMWYLKSTQKLRKANGGKVVQPI